MLCFGIKNVDEIDQICHILNERHSAECYFTKCQGAGQFHKQFIAVNYSCRKFNCIPHCMHADKQYLQNDLAYFISAKC